MSDGVNSGWSVEWGGRKAGGTTRLETGEKGHGFWLGVESDTERFDVIQACEDRSSQGFSSKVKPW